ncbi:MAG: FapA family protein [Proteobacteria bacterium]|nr:FapA family protein [Pseudomonadota bacterium]MBU1688004.1 FapA family protein [Pseudomonadota bacterium]
MDDDPNAQKDALEPEAIDDLGTRQKIEMLATEIFSSRKVSSDGLVCQMLIPPGETADLKIVVKAIDQALQLNFDIPMPRAIKGSIKAGAPVIFSTPSPEELPERTVKIKLTPPEPFVEITGAEPHNGQDGYSELSFDWQRRAGAVSENGTIDWKDINSIPSVAKDALLATIYDRTPGSPGVDCFGKPLKQQPGKRQQIRWNKKSIYRTDDPANENIFRLYTTSGGAVEFHLNQPDDPRTLEKIDITSTFTIKGDITYDYGDLKSSASLEIKGSLKGNFSLQSDGFIHVGGSIEGQEVDAHDIQTALITNGCRVTAENSITATNINNGIATAHTVTVVKNVSNAILTGHEKIIFLPGTTLMGVKCLAPKVEIHQIRIAGCNEIILGEKFFGEHNTCLTATSELQERIQHTIAGIKKTAMTILTIISQLTDLTSREDPSSEVKSTLLKIKNALAENIKSTRPIPAELIELCYQLERILDQAGYNESIIRRVDAMIHHLEEYNTVQGIYSVQSEERRDLRQTLVEVAEKLQTTVSVSVITGCKMMGHNAELRISCGNATLNFDPETMPAGPFTVEYELSEPGEDIRSGNLNLIRTEV